ncbi:hypothetical protein RJT34_17589 [Clitoria ternatea]|uniref:RING-type domain-containing protein n=1 Tax=Clitoria ternatea TaxID=43366 RepID=A0AAN9PDW9_CLITE
MAEPHSTIATLPPPPPPPSGGAATSFGSRFRSQSRSLEGHVNIPLAINWSSGGPASIVRDDTCSCLAVVFSFWFFVSLTMILGVYGSTTIVLGPKSSMVFQPSPVFVQSLKVENLEGNPNPGPMVYGTYEYPSLDVVSTWGENFNIYLPSGSYKDWKYYLNKGSEISLSYHVSSANSSVFLIIADGDDNLSRWLQDPTYPNTTLSWNVILGTGIITQEIFWSSSYYVALGNLDAEVEVELNLSVRASLHNTTNAYYKCDLTNNPCILKIFFPDGNAVVLVSPGPQQNISNEWYVNLSYSPRWMTYIFGTGGMTLLMFWAFNFLNKLQRSHEDRVGVRSNGTTPQRDPLLAHKDDDLSSWDSSYDSMSQDEEDLDLFLGDSIKGKFFGDGETSNNIRRLCAICFDAPRECFFLPCGHCVTCFACGTRIVETSGTCSICRRNIKKVRKIFTV